MKIEVHSAADFLMNLLKVKQGEHPDDNQLQSFKGSLESLLVLRYRSHWYPDLPTRGSGYRCIRINGKMDPVLVQAGVAVGLSPKKLCKMLPPELTLWIDPEEVAYRIGENGSICVLYDSQSCTSPSSELDSTGSGSHIGSDDFTMDRIHRMDTDFTENSMLTSSLPNSTNTSPMKPATPPSMQDGRSYYNGTSLNNAYMGHPSTFQHRGSNKFHQQQQQQTIQFQRQHHINGNIHQQQTTYMHQSQQIQWDGFPTNKVSNRQVRVRVCACVCARVVERKKNQFIFVFSYSIFLHFISIFYLIFRSKVSYFFHNFSHSMSKFLQPRNSVFLSLSYVFYFVLIFLCNTF